jgi:hypothetical protein
MTRGGLGLATDPRRSRDGLLPRKSSQGTTHPGAFQHRSAVAPPACRDAVPPTGPARGDSVMAAGAVLGTFQTRSVRSSWRLASLRLR